MNKQSTQKLSLFLTGLEQRMSENADYFKKLTAVFKSGTKEYTANGILENRKIKLNFSGNTEVLEIDWLSARLCKYAADYESVTVMYEERGSTLWIEADQKNVRMRTKETGAEAAVKPHGEVSHIGNRDYYIKTGQADDLLKAIGILSENGKIKNDMIRKYNQIDHFIELVHDLLVELTGRYESINVLDCGCGKSYLSFVLNYYVKEVLKKPCYFIGLDYSKEVIESSKIIAQKLGYNNMEFKVTDIKNFTANREIHLVISLHACDTATDEAIALGLNHHVGAMVVVPCCHKELLNQYSFRPFEQILKHGILKARIADALTDGMRAMFIEALGYKVSVVEYISPLETPKNLMIRAEKKQEMNKKILEEYNELKKLLNIEPALERLIYQEKA